MNATTTMAKWYIEKYHQANRPRSEDRYEVCVEAPNGAFVRHSIHSRQPDAHASGCAAYGRENKIAPPSPAPFVEPELDEYGRQFPF